MNKILIDITELVEWTGALTGVPRVMDELANRFSKLDDIVFVAWRTKDSSYHKVDYEFNRSVARDGVITEADVSLTKKIKSILKSLKNSTAIGRKVFYVPIKIARKSKRILDRPPNLILDKFAPKKGDTLFILADWHASDSLFGQQIIKLKNESVTIIQMSYDILPLVTPQYSGHSTQYLEGYIANVYPSMDLIITISENTKKDIQKYLKYKDKRVPEIEVIRLGDDFDYVKPVKPRNIFVKNNEFILCVGTIEARKNHTLLYYTYKEAKQRHINLPPVVIVGRLGWLSHDIYEIINNDPDIKDLFIFQHNTSDNELSWLYENCLFTVYPSFYEGWGLPVAESIARGVPCICSNLSSIPEIAGDKLEYFSPYSTEECLEAITAMYIPANLKKAKVAIKSYTLTSWDTAFNNVMRLIGERND